MGRAKGASNPMYTRIVISAGYIIVYNGTFCEAGMFASTFEGSGGVDQDLVTKGG